MFEIDIPMDARELWFLLTAKKRCPVCAGRLERQTSTRDEGMGWRRDGLDFEYGHRTSVQIAYECRPCRMWFTLSDLTARARR